MSTFYLLPSLLTKIINLHKISVGDYRTFKYLQRQNVLITLCFNERQHQHSRTQNAECFHLSPHHKKWWRRLCPGALPGMSSVAIPKTIASSYCDCGKLSQLYSMSFPEWPGGLIGWWGQGQDPPVPSSASQVRKCPPGAQICRVLTPTHTPPPPPPHSYLLEPQHRQATPHLVGIP